MVRFCTAVMAGLLLAGPQPVLAGPSEAFGDWTVTCSDGLDCTVAAVSETASAGYGIVSLALRRTAMPDAVLRLELAGGGTQGVTGDADFMIDGKVAVTIPADDFVQSAENEAYATAAAAVRSTLLPAFLAGMEVSVSAEAGGEAASAAFSLSGLSASLRFVDEVQRRADTPTALVAVGQGPEPDSASLPVDVAEAGELPDAVRVLWEAQPANCGDLGEFVFGPIGFSASLGDSRLFVLRCGMPGAYNAPYALYLVTEDMAQPVPLPTMADAGPMAEMTAFNVDWDDSGKVLRAFFRGRGLGDCGVIMSWRWDDETGAAPVLVSAFAKGECDGALFEPIARWQLWPPRGQR